ncbi:hypothetical protein [Streptomyces ureilyticus]|uniref:hypothetical protein n=1 Tax=Streptomyces ureilyticus TaxID=1775131 RepID=UPI0019D1D91F|nr:hypothetical protein [Streptomyces ureilyticus]
MPQPCTDLSAFATTLAARLPGTWASEYHRHAAYQDQFPTIERLWDTGHVDYIVSQYVLGHDAVLHGPGDEQLYVTDGPRYPHQFVVAPLEPEGCKPHHFRGVDEPNGIAVPNDPVHAAAAVARRVLPRYRAALDTVRHNARVQPEPPHRPAAPEVAQTLTLVWYPDGVVGAPYASVPAEARTVLYGCYFQYSPHESAFVLPASYSTEARALLLQTAVRLLTAQGIGVNFRHAAPAPALPPRPRTATLSTPPSAARR